MTVSERFLLALFVPVFMTGVSVGMLIAWALLVLA